MPTPAARPRRTGLVVGITAAVAVVVAIVAVAGYLVLRNVGHSGAQRAESGSQAVRVASSRLITESGSDEPKAVVSLYEDFLCPACGNFERVFGPTMSRLIDTGAVAVDYYPVAILDGPATDHYSSRAGAAAYCVADESIGAFRRFHDTLFSPQGQPQEIGGVYPDNARLIELAHQAGAGGGVADCINGEKHLAMVKGMAKSSGIRGTPTVRINGEEYSFSTPDEMVGKIKEIVGNVPGL
ncbi:DsbA family protein [Mycobacterium sp. pUA109]